MNCLHGTDIGAGTAIGAYIRINLVNITFRYSINGALINAGAACSTIISNYVCHFKQVLVN